MSIERMPRELIKYWGCGEDHILKGWLHRRENHRGNHNTKESTIMEDMARATPRICIPLDDHQVDRQYIVVEVEGKIAKKSLFILIFLWSSHSYVTQKVVEKKKHNKPWLV